MFLKEVGKGDVHRFTLVTGERELKLRAPQADFHLWSAALKPIVGETRNGRDGGTDMED